MIRKLAEEDRKQVMEYLSAEPAVNLFLLGDIELFGFDKDFQEVWGSFNEQGIMDGVLLRYNDNFLPYFKEESFDDSGFRQIIKDYEGNTMISGLERILKNYIGLLPGRKYKSMYFCELTNDKELKETDEDIKIAVKKDAGRIEALMADIEEFERPSTKKEIEDRIEDKSGRAYFIEDSSGKMLSVAQTTAENSQSAMVVGVATAKEYRNRGLMSACLSKLCKDVLNEGKTLCLFYDNPKAGSVYLNLGFEPIDNWVMIV